MSPTTDLASSLVHAGASGYAGAAAGRLLEERPEVGESFGGGAFHRWKGHLEVRLRELAAALLVGEPRLFVADVVWSGTSFAAREVPIEHLHASLEALSAVLAEELPDGTRDLPLDYLSRAAAELADWRPAAAEPPRADGDVERLALAYLEAALSGDRRRAVDLLLGAVDDGLPVTEVYERVLATAQGRVGEMWHRWELSVPQEHFVTTTTRAAMTLLARRLERRAARGKTVVVALVPGNVHELAAQALADYFEMDGWRTIHLGGEMPASDLALGVEAFEADLLALSIALSTQVREAIGVVRKVRALRPGTRILLGGAVVARTPELWRKLGGDGFAVTFEDALRAAAELVEAS